MTDPELFQRQIQVELDAIERSTVSALHRIRSLKQLLKSGDLDAKRCKPAAQDSPGEANGEGGG